MFVQNLEVGYYGDNTSFHEDLFFENTILNSDLKHFFMVNMNLISTCFLKKTLPFWVQ